MNTKDEERLKAWLSSRWELEEEEIERFMGGTGETISLEFCDIKDLIKSIRGF
jgi:hypothetical protein